MASPIGIEPTTYRLGGSKFKIQIKLNFFQNLIFIIKINLFLKLPFQTQAIFLIISNSIYQSSRHFRDTVLKNAIQTLKNAKFI